MERPKKRRLLLTVLSRLRQQREKRQRDLLRYFVPLLNSPFFRTRHGSAGITAAHTHVIFL